LANHSIRTIIGGADASDTPRTPDAFESVGTRGFHRPVGVMTFEQAIERVAQGMLHARSIGLTELVSNTIGLTGFPRPTVVGRYAFATRWAECGGGVLRLAIVAPAESIDPQKIGVVMARNRGLDTDVFTSEPAAVAWLDSRL
jgi:hypothetical protein